MDKKIFVGLVTALLALSIVSVVEAQPDMRATTGDPSGRTVTIPLTAVRVADHVFSLGISIEDGKTLQGYAILHYKDGFAKPPWAGGGKKETHNYAFLAKGARWKTTEPYVLDSTNNDGLTDDFVSMIIATSFETWDTEVAFEIFGERSRQKSKNLIEKISPK